MQTYSSHSKFHRPLLAALLALTLLLSACGSQPEADDTQEAEPFTVTVCATEAQDTLDGAAATAQGTAERRTGRSRQPFLAWQTRALAAVGRKNSRVIPWAVRWSTPNSKVMTSSKRVPPPTPQAERMPAPRPHRSATIHSVTAHTSLRRRRGRRQRAT